MESVAKESEVLLGFEGGRSTLGRAWLRGKALFWCGWAEKMLQQERPDAIVLWSGLQVYQVAVAKVAEREGVRTFYLENGFFPQTTQLEEFGVNWRSRISQVESAEFLEIERDPEGLEEIFSLPIVPRERRKAGIWAKDERSARELTLPAGFVFVPFQVSKDSQIKLFSPWISDMSKLLAEVWAGVELFNLASNNSLQVVVKEHPSDFGRVDYSELRCQWEAKGVIFGNSVSTAELIEKASVIITINSSVGAEALLRRKPVIVLGQAVYDRPGVTFSAGSAAEIAEALAKMADPDSRKDLEAFVYYLYEKRLVKGHWKNLDKKHWGNLEARLVDCLLR